MESLSLLNQSSLQLSSPARDRPSGLNSFHSNSSSFIAPASGHPCFWRHPVLCGKTSASRVTSNSRSCAGEATLCRDDAFHRAIPGKSSDTTLKSEGSLEYGEVNPIAELMHKRHGEEDVGDADSVREECGVVGIYGDPEASRLCYLSLHALQHRGQEGAGIVTASDGNLHSVTGLGLVADVFDSSKLANLPGASAIGHVRYATAGGSVLKNVQPFVASYRFGSVGVAHNGNLVNYKHLRAELEENGSIFNTSSDTEVLLHLIATSKERPFIARIVSACEKLEGAYSLVFLSEDKLVAVRDPYGFRPLVMGRRKNGAVVFASETCALDLIEADYEREVNPGEVIVVDKEGVSCMCLLTQRQRQACVFEHIYFSMPNSTVFGKSVYQSRYAFGEILAEEAPVDCDVVIAVPDSGVVAALGYAAKAKVPFQQGLIRSHYVGRTFIEPSQKIRDFGVKLKLAPVQAVLQGKRVVVVDDSIVRGTTSSKIVRMIKQAGASEVHMRIASPPIIGSCYYGVDTPSREELISYNMSVEETRKFIGADTLAYLPLSRLRSMLGSDASSFCFSCFSGSYAVPPLDLLKEKEEEELAKSIAGSLDAVVQTRLMEMTWSQSPGPSSNPQKDRESHVNREPAGVS